MSFATLDPSRPAGPAAGRIVAELPDDSGFVLITGSPGLAAGGAGVTVTNVRTQVTSSVLALADGSFRVRIPALVGDELTLTLRGADGRDTTIAITQFVGSDGSITVGTAGGSIPGPGDRTGTILPRALAAPGTFRLAAEDAASLPLLPGGFAYADSFALSVVDASFKTLASLTLGESQNRFAPATSLSSPFTTAAELTTPPDALVNSTLRFTAVVSDADGVRRTVAASTTIVAGTPDTSGVETTHANDFPTLFVTAPREALPVQQVGVSAVAPAARIDLDTPMPANVQPTDSLLLALQVATSEGPRLAVLDQFSLVTPAAGSPRARTTGRAFPGMTAGGHYAIVSTHDQLVFVTGVASGAQATVVVDGLPFVFTTGGPNGRFIVPVRANAAFTLRFYDANGIVRGTTSGEAPTGGTKDIGDPLGSTAGLMTVAGDPNERSVVDINAPLVLRFSEPIDPSTIPGALVVTDEAGSRVFGRLVAGDDGTSVRFTPLRRWRYGTRYRYGVTTSALARSGSRLRAPFGSSFTTFQPVVVGSLPIGDARDVAVAGATAVVATGTGITSIDVASPRAPRAVGAATIPGGANGVTILSGATITDRNGQSHAGPIALVASGGTSSAGGLRSFDFTTPSSPTALGSTQLTNAAGQTPPTGVPAFVGIPQSVAAGADGFAFVAIEGVGASSVQIGHAIPLDATTPARGAGPRYPTSGAESAHDLARLGNRLLVAGVAGLTVLDAATMQRLGGVSTTGNAQGVAALPAFGMDLNGDGVVAPSTEVFDLAVVANGLDGTVQFYRVPETGDPFLLSAVRFAGAETSDVQIDATERLAWVALGSRGLAIVDLDGPASVQPIDADRNGVDDRILAKVGTSAALLRIAVDLRRGLGYGSDPASGVTVLQLLPPRTRFLSVMRDPVAARTGDEQSVLDTRSLFSTDEAVLIELEAASPSGEGLSLVISDFASPPRFAFANFASTLRLEPGLNAIRITANGGESGASAAGAVTLRVVADNGTTVTELSLQVLDVERLTASVEALFVAPRPVVIGAGQRTSPLSVGAQLSDGRLINVTASVYGTHYTSSDVRVATVDNNGLVTAVAGGRTVITVTNESASTTTSVVVQHPTAIVSMSLPRQHFTFTGVGETQSPDVSALFSDGTVLPADGKLGTTIVSSDPGVVRVDDQGRLVAVANGAATITITAAGVSQTVDVFVELRTRPSITSIEITPFAPGLKASDDIIVHGRLIGAGSLEGVAVSANVAGPVTTTTLLESSYGGMVAGSLSSLSSGTFSVTLSVVDPATGSMRAASTTVSLQPGSADNEPNNEPTSASSLEPGRRIAGLLSGSDSRDVYRTDLKADGALSVTLTLDERPASGSLSLVFLSNTGAELQRVPVVGQRTLAERAATVGPVFVAVESTGAVVPYTVETTFNQAALKILQVAPLSGGPGTRVAILGSGFSTDADDTVVLFGSIAGKTVSSQPGQIDVEVPANGVDGRLVVISGTRRVEGPPFSVGNAVATPPVTFQPTTRLLRYDPINQADMNVTLLSVAFEPSVPRAAVEALAASVNATLVGRDPILNTYQFEFATNRSLSAITALRLRLADEPGVRRVQHDWAGTVLQSIDARDRTATVVGGLAASNAFNKSGIFNAIETIRSTPPWCCDRQAFHDVNVAVIDTGFNPIDRSEFQFKEEDIVTLMRLNAGVFTEASYFEPPNTKEPDKFGHGTMITSIIAAVNNDDDREAPISGVLNSIFDPTEKPFHVVVYATVSDSSVEHHTAFKTIANLTGANAVDVVNLSWTQSLSNESDLITERAGWRDTLRLLAGRTLVVAAAGNNRGSNAGWSLPAALTRQVPWVISVGATGTDGITRSYLSNLGANFVDIAAVGESVPVAMAIPNPPTGSSLKWDWTNGTSVAAPQVTGFAALLLFYGTT